MNWKSVRVLFLHETRMLLRDRRTVVLAVVIPLVTMPLILYAMTALEQRRRSSLEEVTYRYSVVGAEAEAARVLIRRFRESSAASEARAPTADETSPFKFEEVQVDDPVESLRTRSLHFYLEALSGDEADDLAAKQAAEEETKKKEDPGPRKDSEEKTERVLREETRQAGVPTIRVVFYADRDISRNGGRQMREYLRRAIRSERDHALEAAGLALDPAEIFAVEESSVASAAQATGSVIGRFLTLFVFMLVLSGGSIVALDIIAGEKERGSLETLLSTAARRSEIVAAKQLTILTVALLTIVIQVANLVAYVKFRVIPVPEDWVIEISPLALLTLTCLLIPVAAFISAVLLMLSAYAKSYKEAQLYFFPVYLAGMVPAAAAALPAITLRSAIAFVPLANVSVATREVMVGKFDWLMIAITMGVMVWAAVAAMRASTRMLSNERLITAGDLDLADLKGGPALFPRRVMRWYILMAVVLFAAAVNVPQLQTFRAQLLFNELVLFLGCPLLMIRLYRLKVKEALALRPVRPAVWPAVLLMIPSGSLVAVMVFRLANLVIPVPRQVLEQFGRDIFPADIPVWQLVIFVALLPGICEEIAFRGTLLYGLRKKLRPAMLALAVGVIFGLFHVALFRIAPTAFLGVILTAVALLTGSIFPGMVIHTGNNALAFWLARSEINVAELHWAWYCAAAAVFASGFYWLYRFRTPYPGLRIDK